APPTMEKPIFCSIYSVDNKRKMQVWFIKQFCLRVSSHEEGKHLRIESDWESIKPTDQLFNDRCKKSKYTMFLFDGTDDDPDLRTLKHYHAIANALDRKGETQFVPIGLCTKALLRPFESLIGQYNLIRFESVSDIENENSWKSLFKDIFPNKDPHTGRVVVSQPSPYQSRERSEDVLMRRVLQGLWVSLKDGLKYTTGHIADHLYQDGIITIDFKGELASKTGTEKTELLLNFIRETPAEQIQRFFDLLQSENKFLYENSVKMKKKFEEDAAALEQSAEIPATQPCPVSSSSFTGARYPSKKLKNILRCKVDAEFAGEASGSGVLLDILSAYWEEFFENYSEGGDEKVIQAHTDLIKDNLKCAGRILRFGFQYCPKREQPLRFFPHQLCLASIINVIHPSSISDNMDKYKAIWSASLYAYVGATSGEKIKAIYEDPKSASEDQWEEINNILDLYFEKNYLVNADNIRDKLCHLAEVYLLQISKTSLELMGLHDWKNLDSEHFGDIDKIVEFSKQFHATSDDVLKAFKRKENINKEEAAALKNLDKFIIGLTLVELKKFLRFVTGSALKPKQILVEFSNDEHRPIKARTCSSLLYIPLNQKLVLIADWRHLPLDESTSDFRQTHLKQKTPRLGDAQDGGRMAPDDNPQLNDG
ncbi:hypothetical protein CAPTEDRAFT_197643, partial [Capitella teleta]